MAASANKTQVTNVAVGDFIAALPDERRRAEAEQLDVLLRRVTGEAPRMWGPSIIGYGSYHYRYDSGREGDMCRIGFSPRKAQLVIYAAAELDGSDRDALEALFARLGPHSLGKGCLYFKRLDKIDMTALEQLLALYWRVMGERYPS